MGDPLGFVVCCVDIYPTKDLFRMLSIRIVHGEKILVFQKAMLYENEGTKIFVNSNFFAKIQPEPLNFNN